MPDDVFGKMAEYQAACLQFEVWPSRSAEGVEAVAIADMAPAHAINALHKLYRWMDHLYEEATSSAYVEAQQALYTSPLVAGLIKQALGLFYEGTFLQETPHLDDVVGRAMADAAPGQTVDVRLGNGWTEVGLKDALLSVAVEVLVEQAAAEAAGTSQRVGEQALQMRDSLYDRVHLYLT